MEKRSNQFYGRKVKKNLVFCAIEHLCAIIRKNTGFNIFPSHSLTLSRSNGDVLGISTRIFNGWSNNRHDEKVECLVLTWNSRTRQHSRDFKMQIEFSSWTKRERDVLNGCVVVNRVLNISRIIIIHVFSTCMHTQTSIRESNRDKTLNIERFFLAVSSINLVQSRSIDSSLRACVCERDSLNQFAHIAAYF